MTWIEWLVSIAALIWLVVIAIFDIRDRQVPNPLWTAVPLVLAAVFRLASGRELIIALAALVAVVISERRQLKNRAVEVMLLAAALVFFLIMVVTAERVEAIGLIGICVFWVSWELRWIGGADAMALITCVLIWPGMAFILAYLVAGIIWSVGVRIREGGWRRGHWVPGLGIIATAAILTILDAGLLHLNL
jgi:Flp pilus assembly protein protease CpaA